MSVKVILEAVESAKTSNGEAVVLSFDPMHQTHNNENGYLWQTKGKDGTKMVPSNSGRRRLNVLGALDMNSFNIVPFLTEENCNKETIKVFLNEVKAAYPRAKTITMFLDNARYQRNYEVQDYAKSLGITLSFMPPYCPNLCLIERLWKFFKKKIMKNRYYDTFENFFNAVCLFFQNWESFIPELKSLFSLNFEIIKAS